MRAGSYVAHVELKNASPLSPLSLPESTRVINTRVKSPAPLPQFADSAQFHLSTFLQAASVAGCRKVEYPGVYQNTKNVHIIMKFFSHPLHLKALLIRPLPRLQCDLYDFCVAFFYHGLGHFPLSHSKSQFA